MRGPLAILIARISLILADVIVLLVTWFATYKKGLIKGPARQHSLLFVILYNGTCYFSVMLIFNVLHIALSFASVGYNSSSFASNVTAFTQPVTNVLIARFLIDLQATNRAAMNIEGQGTGAGRASQSESGSNVDTLRFGAVIGSLGSVLTDADDLEDQDEIHPPVEKQSAPSQQWGSQDGA